ncbi:MAG TPA: gamma-glutamyltransferase family protein [Acetobacteraceae bacterium]|nr:gamma-glutamyltransferase family protein [Acetobacteraceae bacterium]
MPDPAYLSGPQRARRPNVIAQRHVVVSGHYYASLAGLQVLEAGGNAIDAGVATGLAIDVLESQFVGFGGVAPIMIHLAGRNEMHVINGVGIWPKAANLEYFHRNFSGRIPDGLLHTVVPAAPANWIAALERFGTMSFGDVASAAIRFARDGFPTYPFFAEILRAKQAEIRQCPSTAAIFLPDGRVPDVGENFVQADLGRTLQYMADQEQAHGRGDRIAGLRAAHDAFYRGDIASAIVQHQQQNGGWLAAEDLAEFRSRVEKPCRIRFGSMDVYGCGAWSQGPMVLEALNILQGLDLRGMGHNSAAYVHAVTEALKLAAADREVYFGDPDFVDVPLDILLSPDYAARRRAQIDPARAWPGMPPAGEVGGVSIPPWRPDPSAGVPLEIADTKPETSFLCVADRHGNVFAATPSDPTIGGAVVPGTGIVPSMWGSRGYTGPDHPARVGPGRRPRMSANPAIAIKPGELAMPFGSPGSEVLGQAMVQVFLNQVVFGMDPQSACEAPRFASYSWPESTLPHSYRPGHLCVEEDIGAATGDALRALGHQVEWWPERKYLAGSVCTIQSDPRTGVKWAGADPRRTAYAVGW